MNPCTIPSKKIAPHLSSLSNVVATLNNMVAYRNQNCPKNCHLAWDLVWGCRVTTKGEGEPWHPEQQGDWQGSDAQAMWPAHGGGPKLTGYGGLKDNNNRQFHE